ncbi:MAG: hypothetical protein KDA63_07670 [Planctomycetales bacterium]|nr:hypothetical protein [Planctomycetales bacterium]
MRFSILRLTLAAVMITSLVGCSATRERFAKVWPWGKKKYDTEEALANAAPYPTMPSETATPGTPGTGYGTPYAAGMTDTSVASTAGMTQAPAYHTASTAGIYPSAGGYTNPVASVPQSYTSPQSYTATPGTDSSYAATTSPAPNYAGTYGTSTPPAYGAAPTANPYTQPSYAPTMPGYDASAMTAQATTVPQYGATQGYGVSATPTSTAPQTAAGPYGAGSYSYGTVGSATDTVASAAGMPGTGSYAGTGYETTAAPVGATAYAPAANGYQPGNLSYQPGANGYQPSSVPTYQSPAAYQSPSPYTTGGAESAPYRPGGTGDYTPQTSTIPAGGSMSGGSVTPVGYGTIN